METASPLAPRAKLSKNFGFRADDELAAKIRGLATETGRDISDIIRDGVVALWPEFEALNRQLGLRPSASDVARLRSYMDAGQQAHALDIDLAELIRREKSQRALRRAEAAA